MLWTEKYRPKVLKDVVGNGKQKKEIEEWVTNWKEGIPQKCLLLIGPAGVGKTTMAHIIANEFSEYIELNASDKRSYDILINTIGESSNTYSLFGDKHKLIILDEVDGIHGNDDRGGTRAINKIIDNSKHPMIMMANDFYSKRLTTIKKKCQVIKMTKVHTNSINALLKRICVKEGITANPIAIKELAKRSNGDMRSALNILQVIADKKSTLELEDLEKVSQKDNTSNIFDGVRRVLKSKNINKIRKDLYLNEDPTLVMEYIAENIPREYEKPNEIKRAYEMIGNADLYFGRARQSRNYSYWKYASDFMGLGVALSKEETYKKFTKLTGSMAFSLMARSRGKRAIRDKIAEKMAEKLHVSHRVAYSTFPYFEIIFQNNENAYKISSFLELDEDEIKYFRTKKIPKKFIEKMKKEKALKKEEERKKISDTIFKSFPEEPENNKTEDNEGIKSKKEDSKKSNEIKDPNNKELEKKEISQTKEKKEDIESNKDSSQTSLFSF